MLRTVFRSAMQTTDSTLMGCQANKAATIPLRHMLPVAVFSSRKSKIAFAACNKNVHIVMACRV
jgi:hypothetical protein